MERSSEQTPLQLQLCGRSGIVPCVSNRERKLFIMFVIIIIIIIMSCRQHGYPWPSLATSPYRSSFLAGIQGYIQYPQRADVCMFELAVLLFIGHMWGSIGVHLMSSSLLLQQCPACLVRLTLIVFVMRSRWPYSWCLVGCCLQCL